MFDSRNSSNHTAQYFSNLALNLRDKLRKPKYQVVDFNRDKKQLSEKYASQEDFSVHEHALRDMHEGVSQREHFWKVTNIVSM